MDLRNFQEEKISFSFSFLFFSKKYSTFVMCKVLFKRFMSVEMSFYFFYYFFFSLFVTFNSIFREMLGTIDLCSNSSMTSNVMCG